MYDAREKATRDRQWAINASRIEGEIRGEIRGEIKLIRTLEEILQQPASNETELTGKSLEELQAITANLQTKIRGRTI